MALSVVLSLSFNLVIKVAVVGISRSSERMNLNERNAWVDQSSRSNQVDNKSSSMLLWLKMNANVCKTTLKCKK